MSDTSSCFRRWCSSGLVRSTPTPRTGRCSAGGSCAWWGSYTSAWVSVSSSITSCGRATFCSMPARSSWTPWPRHWPSSWKTPRSACPDAAWPGTFLDISFKFDLTLCGSFLSQTPGSCLGEKPQMAVEITSTQQHFSGETSAPWWLVHGPHNQASLSAPLATSSGDSSRWASLSRRFWTDFWISSEFIFPDSGSDYLTGRV